MRRAKARAEFHENQGDSEGLAGQNRPGMRYESLLRKSEAYGGKRAERDATIGTGF